MVTRKHDSVGLRVQMVVEIELSAPIGKSAIREYVREAVANYGGQFHHTSPFWPTKIKARPVGKIWMVRKSDKR
jgi:hypothetical protein